MKERSPCLVLTLLLLFALGIAGCGGTTAEPTSAGSGEKVFTLHGLAEYDGMEGRPAYVAVDGVVYDVSGSRMWLEGQHSACGAGAVAGKDLSEVIERAPASMRALIQKMPVVGELEQ
ncbi:MAG: hypothetical protein JXA87_03315 [Thermoleophilia bacterium]|nr:hypothetical protein [Thermoleophilia bacterium]